jgi:hypothetical protein
MGTGTLDLRRKIKVHRIHTFQPRPPKLTSAKTVLRLLHRASKIFKQMSLFVKTRNPSQCRSQNQKVYRRFKTTRKIVSAFKQEYGAEKFELTFKELTKDPSIKFHTYSDKNACVNTTKSLESNKGTTEAAIQTESSGIFV